MCSVTQSPHRLFETHRAPLSKEFFRQEYWSGLPCPPPGDLPNPGIKSGSPESQGDSLPSEPPGEPPRCCLIHGSSTHLMKAGMLRSHGPKPQVSALIFLLEHLVCLKTLYFCHSLTSSWARISYFSVSSAQSTMSSTY